jgi:nitrate/TMAO reductase-like tetraheme cytochrome c subunit
MFTVLCHVFTVCCRHITFIMISSTDRNRFHIDIYRSMIIKLNDTQTNMRRSLHSGRYSNEEQQIIITRDNENENEQDHVRENKSNYCARCHEPDRRCVERFLNRRQ